MVEVGPEPRSSLTQNNGLCIVVQVTECLPNTHGGLALEIEATGGSLTSKRPSQPRSDAMMERSQSCPLQAKYSYSATDNLVLTVEGI